MRGSGTREHAVNLPVGFGMPTLEPSAHPDGGGMHITIGHAMGLFGFVEIMSSTSGLVVVPSAPLLPSPEASIESSLLAAAVVVVGVAVVAVVDSSSLVAAVVVVGVAGVAVVDSSSLAAAAVVMGVAVGAVVVSSAFSVGIAVVASVSASGLLVVATAESSLLSPW